MEVRSTIIGGKYRTYTELKKLSNDFTDCEFQSITFPRDASLTGYFRNCIFRNCTFLGSFIGGKFFDCEFWRANFERSTFSKACFYNSKFGDLKVDTCIGISGCTFDARCTFSGYMQKVRAEKSTTSSGYQLVMIRGDYYAGSGSATSRGGYGPYSSSYSSRGETPGEKAFREAPQEKEGPPPIILPEVEHYRTPQPLVKWRKKYKYRGWSGMGYMGGSYYDADDEKDDEVEYEAPYDGEYGYGKTAVVECADIEKLKKFCQ